jgi:hypothetical protein
MVVVALGFAVDPAVLVKLIGVGWRRRSWSTSR